MIVKGKIRKRIALLLAMVMALSMELTHVAAADEGSGQMEVSLNVTYGQTDARAMLDMINDFRTGEDAWVFNSSGDKVACDNLGELTYDYDLEQIAMQRAAEIAISFLHTRPNGESSSTVTCNGTRSSAENIAVGYASQGRLEKIFDFLQETDEGYSGQIHRRTMLSSDYTAVGIGHVRYKGMDYWVQEFGTASNSAETSCVDGDVSVPVSIATSKIIFPSLAVDGGTEYTLVSGESVNIPSASLTFYVAGAAWEGTMFASANNVTTDVTPDWVSSDSGIVAVKDGKFVAGQVGNATLTVTYMGAGMEIAVNVVATASEPTPAPTSAPTDEPTPAPTSAPTDEPAPAPTSAPTDDPTVTPTSAPADEPTGEPTPAPTSAPTDEPTPAPTSAPTGDPAPAPTGAPVSDGNKPSESASSTSVPSASSDPAQAAEAVAISQIKTAEAGSTVAMKEGITTLPNAVMKELLKKGDVSLKLEFTYNEEEYVIIIPAGAALDNDISWYGPLYLAQQYGNSAGTAAVETGGVYEVKRGDTLSRIAKANNMTLKQLLSKNPQIRDANKINVGQKINW